MTVTLKENEVILFPTYEGDQYSWKCSLPDPLTGDTVYAHVSDQIELVQDSMGTYGMNLPKITVWSGYGGARCAYRQYRNDFMSSIQRNVAHATEQFLQSRYDIKDLMDEFAPPDNWLSPWEQYDRDTLSHSVEPHEHPVYEEFARVREGTVPEFRNFVWVVTRSGKKYIEELADDKSTMGAIMMPGTAQMEMQSYNNTCRVFDLSPKDSLERNANEIAKQLADGNIESVTQMFAENPSGLVRVG